MKNLMEGRTARMAAATGLLVAGVLASACGGGTPEAKATPAASTPAAATEAAKAAAPAGPAVTMSDVWARATPGLPNENSEIYAVLKKCSSTPERV
ncbi:MAG: hypothetical protein AB7G21_14745, partial [Dehalococcoidia bacterium]